MKIIKGDLTKIEKGYIFQCVNCQNRQGAGLAKSLYTKWLQVKTEYHDYCEGRDPVDLLGDYHVVKISDDLKVVNVFGQLNYGSDGKRYADYGAIKMALLSFECGPECSNDYPGYPDCYFPYLFAAGLSGGDSKIVHKIINLYLPNAILIEYE